MVLITLERKKPSFAGMDIEDCEHRVFFTMQDAEKWLVSNNFYFGQRDFFKYTPADAKEWCHKKDASWEYIAVSIETIDVPGEPSRYKDFDPGIAPWKKAAFEEGRREGYAKTLVESGLSREVVIRKYMNYFNERKEDAEYWISVCEAAGKKNKPEQ